MTSPNPHPSTSLTRAINHLDPLSLSLSPPPPPQNPLLPSTDPLSFKRRTASQAKSIKSGLLGGLLRIDQREEDLVPTGSANYQFEVPSGGGGRARASSMALTFDSERNDDDDEDDDGQRTPTSILAGRWPGKGRPPGRISFSQPVLRDGRYSTSGMLSPGGMGGGRGPTSPRGEMTPPSITLVTTPLPIIPILVLCCAMFGEFLSASTSSPFLYFVSSLSLSSSFFTTKTTDVIFPPHIDDRRFWNRPRTRRRRRSSRRILHRDSFVRSPSLSHHLTLTLFPPSN